MRKITYTLVLIVSACLWLKGQGNTITIPFNGAPPAGPNQCSFLMLANDIQTNPGAFYFCDGSTGTWTALGAGGGSPGGSNNAVQYRINATTFGGVTLNATATNKFLRQVSSGVPTFEQPACADLSDSGTGCSGAAGGVTSVFGRTGAVVAQAADYGLGLIGNPAAGTTFSYALNQSSTWVMQGSGRFTVRGTPLQLGDVGGVSGILDFFGTTSGNAQIGVADVAGTPNRINLPTLTAGAGECLKSDGGSPQALSWGACGAGGGTTVTVGGAGRSSTINLSDSTPAAAGGGINVKWQADSANPDQVSAYLPVSSYAAAKTSATSWTITGATHGLATCDLIVYLTKDNGTLREQIFPDKISCETAAGGTQYDVVVTWTSAQAGNIVLVKNGGAGANVGTVTSIATTSPITGGTITSTGTIACATCVTSAASLTSGQLVAGAGGQAAAVTNLTGDVTTSGGVATAVVNLPDGVTQAGHLLVTNMAAPTSPAAGKIKVFSDSTNLILSSKNPSGVVSNTVVPDAGAANNFLTAISASGVISKAQPAFSNLSGSATTAQLPANSLVSAFGCSFDGAGSTLTVGSKCYLTMPPACTIVAWDIQATGSSPTITFDIWKLATGGTALPTVANTIMGTKPALASGNAVHSTTLTGWTTSVAAHDRIAINIDAVTVATWAEITVTCNKT